MRNGFLRVLLGSLVLAAQVYAQEVIVPRETKPEANLQATPPPEPAHSESTAPPPTKRKSREKKSPTLEEMRMAGARAAEGLDKQSPPQPATSAASDERQPVAELPAPSATPKPVKKETRAGETHEKRRPSSETGRSDAIGPIRPTMMESGREEPSVTPSRKSEFRSEYTPAP